VLIQADVYQPLPLALRFDGGFAGLWLSHVDRSRMDALEPDATVMMFDERDTAARRAATSRTDADGNRYEMRRLADDSRFEILKNWYDAPALTRLLGNRAHHVRSRELEHFWVFGYTRR
jgi:hypothetical protein